MSALRADTRAAISAVTELFVVSVVNNQKYLYGTEPTLVCAVYHNPNLNLNPKPVTIRRLRNTYNDVSRIRQRLVLTFYEPVQHLPPPQLARFLAEFSKRCRTTKTKNPALTIYYYDLTPLSLRKYHASITFHKSTQHARSTPSPNRRLARYDTIVHYFRESRILHSLKFSKFRAIFTALLSKVNLVQINV